MPPVAPITRRPRPRTVSFQVDPAIAEELDRLKERVKANRDVDFNLHGVMEAALKKTLKKATAALDALEEEDRAARASGSSGRDAAPETADLYRS